MKKIFYLMSLVLAGMAFTACNQNEPAKTQTKAVHVFDKDNVDGYYAYAEISVPAGITTLYMENYSGLDAQGHKQNLTVTPVRVRPIVAKPAGGKDVEPFGLVKMLFRTPKKTMVAVYYIAGEDPAANAPANRNQASGIMQVADDTVVANIYALNDFPVDQVEFGQFGTTNYVQEPFTLTFDENGNIRYPEDVTILIADKGVFTYTFAFESDGLGYGYVLTDVYEVKDHVVTGKKINYCKDCKVCPYCMPWGCSCGCGATNPNFVQSAPANAGQQAPAMRAPLTIPDDVTVIKLDEPASYVTSDQEQTFYHSSGVVMFEDSWPNVNQGGVYDTDFDDVVIDYDFEAKTVADDILASEGYREQVKVVIHLRAVGSGNPYRVGVRMEGFDQKYVDRIEQHFTLDSWQNPHGELPAFTESTIQHMSNHYETDPLNPIVEMAHIHTMNQERAGVGPNAEYTYTNGNFVNHTVFNLTYGYKPLDESQYDPALATTPLPYPLWKIQQQHYYNSIPGYINVSGGLVTYTVIYYMKPRIDMDPEERELAKQNMINTVMNTYKQNFYIIADGQYTPIGLKGYDPVFLHSQSKNAFNSKLQQGINAGDITAENPYGGTNGAVWGFKCPTLTRHIWNKLYFSSAYPNYEAWVTSGGTQHADWYVHGVNEMYLTCWW